MPKAKKPRKANSSGNLCISFHDICLDNLPEGKFIHRRITPEDATQRIVQARQEKRLLCFSNDDILAPYHKHERKDHEDLCKALKKHFGITLSLRDFTIEDGNDGGYFMNPLCICRIEGHDQLLVITCTYSLNTKSKKLLDTKIDPENVKFHVIEAA